jgi:soluble lytic murein transglycosylase-like protein
MQVESGGNPNSVSRKGAMGLMQLMPGSASTYGAQNPFDPEQNIDAGSHELSDLMSEFGGNLDLALAAYNAGAGAVRQYGGVPPYSETQNYVRKIRSLLGEQ